jgi:hypothetical protein
MTASHRVDHGQGHHIEASQSPNCDCRHAAVVWDKHMTDGVWRKHYMGSLQSNGLSGDDTNRKLLVWGHVLWPFERDYAVWRVGVEQ